MGIAPAPGALVSDYVAFSDDTEAICYGLRTASYVRNCSPTLWGGILVACSFKIPPALK